MDNYSIAAAELIRQSLSAAGLASVDDIVEIGCALVFGSQCVAHSIRFPVSLAVLRLIGARPRDLTALTHRNPAISFLPDGLLFL